MPRALLRTVRSTHGAHTRRWASYESACLANKALAEKVVSTLRSSSDDSTPGIDQIGHTIETSAGRLPLSPVFDPAWMKARRRQRKADPAKPTGRFRKKLANNPFARALDTPIRKCPITAASLPRFFLQDFETVTHPDTGTAWWAPGPLSFPNVSGKNPKEFGNPTDQTTGPDATSSMSQDSDNGSRNDKRPSQSQSPSTRPRGPLTSYTLCRMSVVDALGGKNRRNTAMLLAVRSGMAVAPDLRNPVWREDMGEVLLQLLRRRAADALISWGTPMKNTTPDHAILHPCSDWAEADNLKPRGCVLWLPGAKPGTARTAPYTTLDVASAQYDQKIVVHNLCWLLGESEVGRLKQDAIPFREHEIVVLRQGAGRRGMELHLLLWRLHGYLARN